MPGNNASMKFLVLGVVGATVWGCVATKPVAEVATSSPKEPDQGRKLRARDASVFQLRPYIQIGSAPSPASMTVAWSSTSQGKWTINGGGDIQVDDLPSGQKLFRATIPVAENPAYSIELDGRQVWSTEFKPLKPAASKVKLAVFGDCGMATPAQADVAKLVDQQAPDMVLITGDIVYADGKVSQYKTNFWPYYNGETGGLMMERIPFVAAAGNHDVHPSKIKEGDAYAYYQYWLNPGNGPKLSPTGPSKPPMPSELGEGFREATGGRFPSSANFSFDQGPLHITVLDSNTYANWGKGELAEWLKNDLSTTKQPWKIVMFHHPPFHSSNKHKEDKMMRAAAKIFEDAKVDLVLAGHVHNYQRSKPLRLVGDEKFELDTQFDGSKVKQAKGPIYLVEGAGGAPLYDINQDFITKQPFTEVYIGRYGFGSLEADAKTLSYRHFNVGGEVADKFELAK